MRYLTESDLPDRELNHRLADPLSIVELEIGISVGRFLCQMASVYHNRFFVGVELKPKSSRLAALSASRKSLKNGAIINIEAHNYIRKWVSDSSFEVIHIYFPTPYPSALHLSHRLMSPEFVNDAFRILKPGGVLRIVTDDRDYYDELCGLFSADKWWTVNWQSLGLKIPKGYFVGTGHELTFRRKYNAPIYALQMIRMRAMETKT